MNSVLDSEVTADLRKDGVMLRESTELEKRMNLIEPRCPNCGGHYMGYNEQKGQFFCFGKCFPSFL